MTAKAPLINKTKAVYAYCVTFFVAVFLYFFLIFTVRPNLNVGPLGFYVWMGMPIALGPLLMWTFGTCRSSERRVYWITLAPTWLAIPAIAFFFAWALASFFVCVMCLPHGVPGP